MIVAKRTCEVCRHWNRLEPGLGECRRNSPSIVTIIQTEDVSITNKAIWPRTFDNEWCGEFKPHHSPT